MKKLKYIYISLLAGALTLSGCSDWLTVYPENQQANDAFWKTKEDVEAVVNSGYYYLRQTVESQLIPFGELRGSILYSRSSNSLQNFQTKSTEEQNSSWGPFYRLVNTANSSIHNADQALTHDATYDRNLYTSHF